MLQLYLRGRQYFGGFAYFCEECDFNLDVECAFIRPAAIKEGEEEEEVVVVGTHHFTHPEHPLLLWENIPASRIGCRVCNYYCSDQKTYGCLPCGFFLHPSCFKLPQEIVHPCHPDHGPLTLIPIKYDDDVICNVCRNDIYGDKYIGCFAYICEECDFNLDVECAFIRPAEIEEGDEEEEAVVGTCHFLHSEHPLLLFEMMPTDRTYCSLCGKYCLDQKTYGCLPCGFFLHPSCFKLPQEIVHPFHPDHGPLTLKPINDPLTLKHFMDDDVKCNACCNYIYGDEYSEFFAYFCEECDFNLDVECAFIRPAAIKEGEEEEEVVVVGTHHFTHPEHPLLLWENIPASRIGCRVCNYYCSDQKTYGCLSCGFFLHPSCFKLPQEIVHPFHPYHGPLTLKPINDPLTPKHFMDDDVKCNACRNDIYGDECFGCVAYFCEECDFNLDVECAFIRPAVTEEGEEEAEAVVVGTHHFSRHHEHPLVTLENMPADSIRCLMCRKYCSDPKTYGCLPCGFFLHPSCFKLPLEIFRPLHPYHPLSLEIVEYDDDHVKCNACRNLILGYFAYFCEHCNNTKTRFCLDVECASVIMPAITYEGHDHLLQFNHNIRKNNRGDDEQNCSACKSTCKSTCESCGFRCLDLHSDDLRGDELIKYCSACSKSITRESYAFRCLGLKCDFSLHLACGPLPSTIQHKSHIHPLILTNCPIEDEEDCKQDEFFCYACEEERDPFLPIYYCNECPFVAEISCVISEVRTKASLYIRLISKLK
jgi:hypothetical protein